MQNISLIVAASINGVIGKDNQLIWRLSADLQRFKKLTTGHHIIMGRKTYESIGKPLPNRTTVIITRNKDFKAEGCIVVNSLQDAINTAKNDNKIFIIGGADIYSQSLSIANRIYFTLVNTIAEGDAHFAELNNTWKETFRQSFIKDEKNEFDYSFINYDRV